MRQRATVLCVHMDEFLAVQGRGDKDFSLPGGAVEWREQPIVAAIRELYEETGLKVESIKYLTSFQGTFNHHEVFIATPHVGRIKKQHKEIQEAVWFPLDTPMQGFQSHVIRVIEAFKESNE